MSKRARKKIVLARLALYSAAARLVATDDRPPGDATAEEVKAYRDAQKFAGRIDHAKQNERERQAAIRFYTNFKKKPIKQRLRDRRRAHMIGPATPRGHEYRQKLAQCWRDDRAADPVRQLALEIHYAYHPKQKPGA